MTDITPKNSPKKASGKKSPRRRLLTAVLIAVLTSGLIVGLFSLYAVRHMNHVTLIMPYDSREFSYGSDKGLVTGTAEPFAKDLAVSSSGDIGRSGVGLQGSEKGGLFAVSDPEVLYGKGLYEKVYPASITKLMTAILAFENGDPDSTVVIRESDLDLESGSQVIGLKAGDQVRLGDLITAMLVHSGNDAAQAIARTIGGSQEAFVQMMNDKARAIGATGTHFVNPSGLHDADHYTTCYDIYLMMKEAIRYDQFLSDCDHRVYELTYKDMAGSPLSITLDSTDLYLTGQYNPPSDVTIIGGKTGTTASAGSCLALVSQNAYGELYISVIVGAQGKEALYTDMNTLLKELR